MKKLFTIDDFMIAFVSALGYGLGETISRFFGLPKLVCLGASMAAGIALESIINKIVFSEAVQKKTMNRLIIYTMSVLAFLAAHYLSVMKMGVSLTHYLLDQFVWVAGIPILGFIVTMVIRAYRAQKIRRLYGDGREGYVFDVNNEEIEELNKQNQPVRGSYDTDCAVKTRTGIYVGEIQKKTISFLGIPYAKPPVGRLRWKAPEPLPSSEEVFEAKYFGASAVQVEHKGSLLKHHRQSEDCLSLNICTGIQETEYKKPVLVMFHHGDFSYEGSVDPLLYGNNFVSRYPDIVFVSFNYRIGILGFIDFTEVPGGEACPDALNLGLLDQIAALKWIKENIAAFGGDPDRITVIGFESGGTSISLLAASERAKGLFQKAFVFFGSPETSYDTPDVSRALARSLLKETHTGTMEELIKLKEEDLKDAAQRLWKNMCAPTCDGTWIPADVYQAYQDGAASGIEFIIGIPGNERQVFRSFVGNENYESLVSAGVDDIQKYIGQSISSAIHKYIKKQTVPPAGHQAASDGKKQPLIGEEKWKLVEQWHAFSIYRSAVKLSEGGNKVYLMYWDEKPLIENLGSGTVDVVATMLGNREALQMYGSLMNEDLSEILQSLLQKFIKGEELQLYPNEIKGVDAIEWKAFPRALIAADEKIVCGRVEDRLYA